MFSTQRKKSQWFKGFGVMMALVMALSFAGFGNVAKANVSAAPDLYVSVDGGTQTFITNQEIIEMSDRYIYSGKNSFGTTKYFTARGAKLSDIAVIAGTTAANVQWIDITVQGATTPVRFSSADLFSPERQYFPSTGGVGYVVPCILAYAEKEAENAPDIDLTTDNAQRLFFGQFDVDDITVNKFAKNVEYIDFVTFPPAE